jgi:protein TonB
MSTTLSTGIRFVTAAFLGLMIQGALFAMLKNMTESEFTPEAVTSTRIEFTRIRKDTETNTRREQEIIQQPRVEDLPRAPKLEIAMSEVDVGMPVFAPTVDLSAALKNAGISMGTESDVLPMLRIPPVYPRNAKLAKIQGFVKMEVVINPDGTVNDITVIEATPPRMFDNAAVSAMKQWKFKPKLINGVAVSQRAQQVIEFKLEG